MSLELPGSYEKGHLYLVYHTVKQVLTCFLNIAVFLNLRGQVRQTKLKGTYVTQKVINK